MKIFFLSICRKKIIATQFLSCLHEVHNFFPFFPPFYYFLGQLPLSFLSPSTTHSHSLTFFFFFLSSTVHSPFLSNFISSLLHHHRMHLCFITTPVRESYLCFITTLSVSLSPWFVSLPLFELLLLVHSFSLHELSPLCAPIALSCASFSRLGFNFAPSNIKP